MPGDILFAVDEATWDEKYADRCQRCGRTDVDDQWLWLEAQRAHEDVDCEFETVDLVFCSQAHAGEFLQHEQIDWSHVVPDDVSSIRVDRYFLGCGLLAIILSVVGLISLARWVF